VNSNRDDDLEDDLPEDTNSNSEQMDSDKLPLVPEQGTVNLNLDKELQDRVVEEAVNEGGIPEQEDGEPQATMGRMVDSEVEQVQIMVGRGDRSVDDVVQVVPTVVQNPEDFEEAVVDIRADDSVSFLLSNVREIY
jgi:hypothetical protein